MRRLPVLQPSVFFGVTVNELLDFDRHRIDREVEALVEESVPLRREPEKAEAFWAAARASRCSRECWIRKELKFGLRMAA